mmetsp:Transcript_17045/g.28354  ORF Transcript_17045/g.28354 Transcript_17045/m.28354 type:complete len:81 (-) Transcript_17045:323-565(-)
MNDSMHMREVLDCCWQDHTIVDVAEDDRHAQVAHEAVALTGFLRRSSHIGECFLARKVREQTVSSCAAAFPQQCEQQEKQ